MRVGARPSSSTSSSPSGPEFKLEQLEPRVLLSADNPLLAEAARLAAQGDDGSSAQIDVLAQQLDAATSAEIAAAAGADSGGASLVPPIVAWGAGWGSDPDIGSPESASEGSALQPPQTTIGSESAVALSSISETIATLSVVSDIQDAEANQKIRPELEIAIACVDYPGAQLPRGPPGDIASDVAGDPASNNNNTLASNDSPPGDEGGRSFLLYGEKSTTESLVDVVQDDDGVRAVSEFDLQPLLQQALGLWTQAGLTQVQTQRLAQIQVSVIDLPAVQLGWAEGLQINIDTDAGGRGWFVDDTPGDASEFVIDGDGLRIAASSAGPAFGRVDLLTVMVHEVGHVLGFDHASGIEVMAEHLGRSERVLLGAIDGTSAPATEGVSDASTSPPTLDLSAGANDGLTITLRVNSNGSIDVSGTATGDNGTGVAGITNIIGNAAADITLIGPDLASTWDLSTSGGGTLDPSGLPTITFTGIATLTGGTVSDEFNLTSSFTSTVAINGGGGDDRLTVSSSGTAAVTFDGGTGNADTVVNEAGTTGGVALVSVETVIDRPLLFIPGFAGTTYNINATPSPTLDGDTALEEWLLNRGIHPDRIVLEALAEGYSDIVQTLANIGYVDSRSGNAGTLFAALWDWRVPVALADGTDDGALSNVNAASLLDLVFETSLDYLGYWMNEAVTDWIALTGAAPDAVDVLTHSTGGLVARSYIQSGVADDSGVDVLLPVHMLVQSGVPNQGTGAPFMMLNDDFSVKSSTRGLGLLIGNAWELKQDGGTVRNPDGSALVAATKAEFVQAYIGAFHDLLAAYPFLDDLEDGTTSLRALLPSDELYNSLLADLNAHALDDFVARGELEVTGDALPLALSQADANADGTVTFAELLAEYDTGALDGVLSIAGDSLATALSDADRGDELGGAPDGIVTYDELLRFYDRQTYVVYSSEVDTPDLMFRHVGPSLSAGLQNETLSIGETIIGHFPSSSEVWYEVQNSPTSGDGTVATFSARDGFVAFRLVEVSALVGADVGHSEIVYEEISQRKILELLGVTDATVATISTGLLLNKAQTAKRLVDLGLVNPVELVRDAYDGAMAKIAELKAFIDSDSRLNTRLPVIDKTLAELLNEGATGIGLDAFFAKFPTSVGAGVSAIDFASFESLIETELGLAANEFAIVNDLNTTGKIEIVFDLTRANTYARSVQFGEAGSPLEGSTTLSVTLDLDLDFGIVIDLGTALTPDGEGDGTAGIEIVVRTFEVAGTFSAADIDILLQYAGLGEVEVENGSANIGAAVAVDFQDTDATPDALSIVRFFSASTYGSLIQFSTPSQALDFNLPVTATITAPSLQLSGTGTIGIDAANVFNGQVPTVSFQLNGATLTIADFLSVSGNLSITTDTAGRMLITGAVAGAGPNDRLLQAGPVTVSGSAQFALTRETTDLDTDGDGAADLIGATLDTVAFSVPGPTGITLVVDQVASLTLTGSFAVVRVVAAGETAARYTALKMGTVTATGGVSGGTDFGVAGTIAIESLDFNAAAAGLARLDWTRAFNLDSDPAPEVLNPGINLGAQPNLTIDFTRALEYSLAGTITGDTNNNDRILLAGPVVINATQVDFAASRRTADIDTDGNGVADLIGAVLDMFALSVTNAELVVDQIAAMTLTGQLALVRVSAAGQSNSRYSALKMGNVTVTASTESTTFGLTGSMDIDRLDYNAFDTNVAGLKRLDWTKAVDLDGDGDTDLLDPGALLTGSTRPTSSTLYPNSCNTVHVR